jgi:hypothetical protein
MTNAPRPRQTIKVSNPIAREALIVGHTDAGGSVEVALHAYLMTPRGGSNQTAHAWGRLTDAIAYAVPNAPLDELFEAARDLWRAAAHADRPRHPSRTTVV